MLFWLLVDLIFIVAPAVYLVTITARRKTAILAALILVMTLAFDYQFVGAADACGAQAPLLAMIGAPILLLEFWPATVVVVLGLWWITYRYSASVSRRHLAIGLTVFFVLVSLAAIVFTPSGLISGDVRYPCAIF